MHAPLRLDSLYGPEWQQMCVDGLSEWMHTHMMRGCLHVWGEYIARPNAINDFSQLVAGYAEAALQMSPTHCVYAQRWLGGQWNRRRYPVHNGST